MDELLQDLGSSIALTQHSPYNTWQEISDDEDDEKEWTPIPKTSLSIQDSMGRPKLVSWASEMSMYDGQSSHSLGKHTASLSNMNSNRYISALDLLQAQPGKSQVLHQRNSLRKANFHIGTNGKDCSRLERKLNFLQAVKRQKEKTGIKCDETKCNTHRVRSRELVVCDHVNDAESSNGDALLLSVSGSDKPCLSNRASQEERTPIKVLEQASRMEEPVLNAVTLNEKNGATQQAALNLSSSIKITSRQQGDIPASVDASPRKAFSSPNQQPCLIEHPTETSAGHPAERLSQPNCPGTQADFIMEYKKEVEALRTENILLKKKIVMMSEHSMFVENELKKVNERLVDEIVQLQHRLKMELVGNMEKVTPRSPMRGVMPKGLSTEAPQQRSPYLVACQGQSTVIPRSPNRIPSEMKFLTTTKVGLSEEASEYDIAPSPMNFTTASKDKSNVESMNVNQFVEKKDNLEREIERSKEPPTQKNEISPASITNSANSKINSNKGDVEKNNRRRGIKKDKEKNSSIKPPTFDFTNLIVNYLPPEMDSTWLQRIFSQYGEIVSCKVVMDHKTGLSKGYGFVKFKTKEQAMDATEGLDQASIGGKVLKVACARKNERGAKPENRRTNLYIANLDKNIETEDIKRVFGSCGYVVQCRVLKDVRGVTRRIGFVRFDTHESALRAIKRYDGKRMEGSKSIIQVRFANVPKPPPSAPKLTPLQVSFPAQHAGQYMSPTMSQVDSPQSILPFPSNLAGYAHGVLLPPESPHDHYTSISPRNLGLGTAHQSTEGDLRVDSQPNILSSACYVAGVNAANQANF